MIEINDASHKLEIKNMVKQELVRPSPDRLTKLPHLDIIAVKKDSE